MPNQTVDHLRPKLRIIFEPSFQDKTLSFVKSEEELKLILKEVRFSSVKYTLDETLSKGKCQFSCIQIKKIITNW